MSFGIPTRNGLSLGLGAVPTLATNFGLPIPSLSLDYTIPSDGTPGVAPGFYQVDNGFGVLTQTTFSSLITFSRASNATRFSPTGQLEYAPHNLLLQSQTLDNATWSKSSVTVTANAGVAPDGTTTADKVIPTAVSSQFKQLQQNITVVAGTTYTFSGFYKADGYNFVQLIGTSASFGTFSVNFDLSNGTETDFAAGTSTVVARFIENYGNGWYRIGVSVICLGSSSSARLIDNIIPASNSVRGVTWTGDGTSGVLTWGLQIAVGPNALDYTPTTTAVVYGPRFDYDPTTLAAKGLLIEEQRTNSIRNNTMVGAVAGTPGTNPTNWAIATSIDGLTKEIVGVGVQNGVNYIDIRLYGTSGTLGSVTAVSFDSNTQIAASNGQTWTGSSWVAIVAGNTTNVNALTLRTRFNDVAGASLTFSDTSLLAATATMQRIAVSSTASNASTSFVNMTLVATFADNSVVDITLRIGLPQLELGAFATSVIPTTTAATTRSADIASIGTLSPWYNATEGTLYIQSGPTNPTVNVGQISATIGDGTANNRMYVGKKFDSATVAEFGITVSGSGQGFLLSTPTSMTNFKLAAAYKVNDFASVIDGGAVVTDTSGIIPVVNLMYIGALGASSSFLCGYIRRITYTPRRLTNAELQSLTS